MKNYFIDTAQFKKFDKIRFVYLIVFILSFIFTELRRNFYRPYIYENRINDFGLADSIGNWGGILVQIFFGLVIVNPIKIKGIRLIIFSLLDTSFTKSCNHPFFRKVCSIGNIFTDFNRCIIGFDIVFIYP